METLQEGHTTCIICMEVVEDSLSYTTMVCPSCKHAWFHRGCIQVGGPSLCQPAGTPCARSGVLLTRGVSLPQGQALRAGLRHFACPHCRDWERFVPEMLQMGIRVPNMCVPSLLPTPLKAGEGTAPGPNPSRQTVPNKRGCLPGGQEDAGLPPGMPLSPVPASALTLAE